MSIEAKFDLEHGRGRGNVQRRDAAKGRGEKVAAAWSRSLGACKCAGKGGRICIVEAGLVS